MKLQDKLDGIKKDFERKAPKEALKIMHHAVDDLRNSGILDRTVSVGDKAPEFTLKNTKRQEVTLNQLLSEGPIVLGFYRGRW
jgi:uncharacterized protein YjgD (DUF1641 family)